MLTKNIWFNQAETISRNLNCKKTSFKKKHTLQRAKYTRCEAPKIKVIEDMLEVISNHGLPIDLKNTSIVMVQHLTESTLTLAQAFITLGITPGNVYLMGKYYSTSIVVENELIRMGIKVIKTETPKSIGRYKNSCLRDVNKLWSTFQEDSWDKNIDRLIIMDEGGNLISEKNSSLEYRYPLAAVEHTTAGLKRKCVIESNIPLIQVASCALKIKVEPPLIVDSALRKLEKKILTQENSKRKTFGVAGNGHIGKAVANHLYKEGYDLVVYDPNPNAFSDISFPIVKTGSILELVEKSDIIIGCSGENIFSSADVYSLLLESTKTKTFVSCSSEDKEFLSVLEKLRETGLTLEDPLDDIIFESKHGANIRIVRGGYPISFDNSPIATPTEDIALTMALLLGGFLQAIYATIKYSKKYPGTPKFFEYFKNKHSLEKLDPFIQAFIIKSWGEGRDELNVEQLSDIEWLLHHSDGNYVKYKEIEVCFSKPKYSGDFIRRF